MTDTRTAAERAYDLSRLSPLPDTDAAWEAVQAITDDPTDNGRDTPLSADEQRCLDILLASEVRIVRSRDAAHREERILTILERIAAMDEPEQSEMFGYAMGLFDGLAMRGK